MDLTSTLSFFDKFLARHRATCGVADLAVSMDLSDGGPSVTPPVRGRITQLLPVAHFVALFTPYRLPRAPKVGRATDTISKRFPPVPLPSPVELGELSS